MDIKKYKGLSSKQVNEKIYNGEVNRVKDKMTKSMREIVLANTLTFFNVINVILFILVISVGSYKNALFGLLIVINTSIGIFQEIKAKRILDKLSILTLTPAKVIRDGKVLEINIKDIVKNDYILLQTGDQVPADIKIIEGEVEVNESLLTGESDAQDKGINENLFSGSYITSGECIGEVIKVGEETYTHSIVKEAKMLKRAKSELFTSINKVLKVVSFIIVPIGILLFCKEFFVSMLPYPEAVLKTVAALLGMVPQGLVLLTTVALTLSVIRLSKQKTLVQELYCIETLARVDTLCLDKTGTITEGKMRVEGVDILDKANINEVMGSIVNSETNLNATLLALKDYYKEESTKELLGKIPFSSKRKYSAYFYEDGTYYLGAKEFLFPDKHKELDKLINEYANMGLRVIVLAYSKNKPKKNEIVDDLKPIAIFKISDIIRKDAKETLAYFVSQGVDLKIISGDDALTVSKVAKRAGFKNYDSYIDVIDLKNTNELKEAVLKYSIFGRVSPEQKKEMLVALKEAGHTVAMVGDGVNDCLALKEADCSIAMASGSDAAKRSANLVLFNNDFSAMPHIVNEGRRVINNITYSASLFLIKTLYSSIMAILTIIIGKSYPFLPIQLSVMVTFCVSIPSFFLTYEPNFNKVKHDFLTKVFEWAFPYAFTIAILLTSIMTIGSYFGAEREMLTTICVFLAGWNYMRALEGIYSPLSKFRKTIIYTCEALYFIAMIILRDFLSLTSITYVGLVVLMFCGHFLPVFYEISKKIYKGIINCLTKLKIIPELT